MWLSRYEQWVFEKERGDQSSEFCAKIVALSYTESDARFRAESSCGISILSGQVTELNRHLGRLSWHPPRLSHGHGVPRTYLVGTFQSNLMESTKSTWSICCVSTIGSILVCEYWECRARSVAYALFSQLCPSINTFEIFRKTIPGNKVRPEAPCLWSLLDDILHIFVDAIQSREGNWNTKA
jgi:hypothetical protein